MTSSNQFDTLGKNARFERLTAGKISHEGDWQSYTPTFTSGAWGTTTVNDWRYKVVGRSLTVKGLVVQSGAGTLGSGTYTLSLPPGCIGRLLNYACGNAYFEGPTHRAVGVVRQTNTSFTINYVDPTSGTLVLQPWGAVADTEFRLDSTSFVFSVTFEIELSTNSAILK